MSNSVALGFDLGSQKSMIVAEDGEIIRTSTGSHSRSTLVSFADKRRLFGEEASAQILSDHTIALVNLMAGRTADEIKTMPCFSHKKLPVTSDAEGRLVAEVNYRGEMETVNVTSLLAMYLVHLYEQASVAYGDNTVLCFPLHPNHSSSVARAYREAAVIAGIDESRVFIADTADSLIATYARKITGLGGAEKNNLIGKNVLLVDSGMCQTTIVVCRFNDNTPNAIPEKIAVLHDENLGAYHFDLKLFDHFAAICQTKHKAKIEAGTKRGNRLLSGCERIRKLLSQLTESQVTVEHLIEDGDVHFSLKRDEMYHICKDLLERLRALIQSAIAKIGGDSTTIDVVEIVGGASRMPALQQAITQFVGESIPLGAKMDDGSVALGAALLYRKTQNDALAALEAAKKQIEAAAAGNSEASAESQPALQPMEVEADEAKKTHSPSVGLSAEEIAKAREKELDFQAKDNEIRDLHAAYNNLESYLLEMRNAPRRKHGELINANQLNQILDDNENWLSDNWDNTFLKDFQDKYAAVQEQVTSLCADYFTKVNEEKVALEKQLQEESLKAQQEREANGEDDEDHDTRKLKKADRMRLVVKNKDEGNELFKGNNHRMAAARYHKALTHANKFFDLTPEDENEVKQLKISLYNNLATCYLKLENFEQLHNNVKEVLKLDDKNVKALFRFSQYYENKKEFEKALECLESCQKFNPTEDKLVTKNIEKIRKDIAKLKDKEKKMWSKAFS